MIDLGKLCDNSTGVDVHPPASVNALMAFADSDQLSDQQVVQKAMQDAKTFPSVWFVNFVDPLAAAQPQPLAKHMQNVNEYRNWASFVWWRTVFNQRKLPQDDSEQSVEKRSAYCAKVASYHMKQTPWLGMNLDQNVSKSIECNATDFHTKIAETVLEGFVSITPSNVQALEGIFTPLRLAISEGSENISNKTIICQRYQYTPEIDVVKSYVRAISFNVTDDMKNVNNAKRAGGQVRCRIEYNEYEAIFNEQLWSQTSGQINEDQKTVADDLRKQQTVDCS
ncbi:hypothetical protein QQZ08_010631 [Neonectria magnoliae]|uniref:Uncharacterized protein n=1 Tax=Neonectria magnoliae TaxID=2732573 RepID=A0ABR1HGP9_9HYPO